MYRQTASEVHATCEALGLSSAECELLTRLHKGQAIWRVGAHSHLVQHVYTTVEQGLIDTDAQMRDESRPA